MKKLMIAFAVAAVAAFAQAATVDWKLSSKNTIQTYSGGDGASITIYLLDTGATDYAKTIAGIADGSITSANITSQAGYLTQGTTGASGAKVGKASGSATVDTAGTDYSMVFVYFETVDTKNYYYLSGAQTGKSYDGSAEYPTGTAASWMSDNYAQSNWHEVTTSVPEPTSGLLILLGMAGLALRRRRA